MKKIVAISIMALAVAGGVAFAQAAPWGWGPGAYPAQVGAPTATTIKVEGKLELVNGAFAVQSGKTTYYVPWVGRYVGFIDGLKEGTSVKIEGYATPLAAAPEYSMLAPTKFTVNGKDYDFSTQYQGYGYGYGYGMHRGRW